MENLEIDKIRKLILDRKIRWTNHSIIRLLQRNITQEDIEQERRKNNYELFYV